jgi:SAM-dependent methyltransferase
VTRLYEDDAELYDIAFDWDISDEADWLVERLQATTVLEPGCGAGRMLEALADRGYQVVGPPGSDPASRSCQGLVQARSSRRFTR